MLDPRTAGDRADRRAQLQQRRTQAHRGRAARQQQQVGGNDGGRVDQPEPGHPQHAVNEVRAIIAGEIFVHELRVIGQRALLRAGRVTCQPVGILDRIQGINSR